MRPVRQNSFPGSYHHPPGRGKLFIAPGSIFFSNTYLPAEREERGNYAVSTIKNILQTVLQNENKKSFILTKKMMNGYFFLSQKMLLKCCWNMFMKFLDPRRSKGSI